MHFPSTNPSISYANFFYRIYTPRLSIGCDLQIVLKFTAFNPAFRLFLNPPLSEHSGKSNSKHWILSYIFLQYICTYRACRLICFVYMLYVIINFNSLRDLSCPFGNMIGFCRLFGSWECFFITYTLFSFSPFTCREIISLIEQTWQLFSKEYMYITANLV